MGSRIGELQDLAHPVIETLRAAIEQHQRGVAGHELEVMGVRPRSGERQPLARHGHEDNLAVPCGSSTKPKQARKPEHPGDHRQAIALAQVFLGLFRSEEHTSELQSLMRISYAVFCLQKK